MSTTSPSSASAFDSALADYMEKTGGGGGNNSNGNDVIVTRFLFPPPEHDNSVAEKESKLLNAFRALVLAAETDDGVVVVAKFNALDSEYLKIRALAMVMTMETCVVVTDKLFENMHTAITSVYFTEGGGKFELMKTIFKTEVDNLVENLIDNGKGDYSDSLFELYARRFRVAELLESKYSTSDALSEAIKLISSSDDEPVEESALRNVRIQQLLWGMKPADDDGGGYEVIIKLVNERKFSAAATTPPSGDDVVAETISKIQSLALIRHPIITLNSKPSIRKAFLKVAQKIVKGTTYDAKGKNGNYIRKSVPGINSKTRAPVLSTNNQRLSHDLLDIDLFFVSTYHQDGSKFNLRLTELLKQWNSSIKNVNGVETFERWMISEIVNLLTSEFIRISIARYKGQNDNIIENLKYFEPEALRMFFGGADTDESAATFFQVFGLPRTQLLEKLNDVVLNESRNRSSSVSGGGGGGQKKYEYFSRQDISEIPTPRLQTMVIKSGYHYRLDLLYEYVTMAKEKNPNSTTTLLWPAALDNDRRWYAMTQEEAERIELSWKSERMPRMSKESMSGTRLDPEESGAFWKKVSGEKVSVVVEESSKEEYKKESKAAEDQECDGGFECDDFGFDSDEDAIILAPDYVKEESPGKKTVEAPEKVVETKVPFLSVMGNCLQQQRSAASDNVNVEFNSNSNSNSKTFTYGPLIRDSEPATSAEAEAEAEAWTRSRILDDQQRDDLVSERRTNTRQLQVGQQEQLSVKVKFSKISCRCDLRPMREIKDLELVTRARFFLTGTSVNGDLSAIYKRFEWYNREANKKQNLTVTFTTTTGTLTTTPQTSVTIYDCRRIFRKFARQLQNIGFQCMTRLYNFKNTTMTLESSSREGIASLTPALSSLGNLVYIFQNFQDNYDDDDAKSINGFEIEEVVMGDAFDDIDDSYGFRTGQLTTLYMIIKVKVGSNSYGALVFKPKAAAANSHPTITVVADKNNDKNNVPVHVGYSSIEGVFKFVHYFITVYVPRNNKLEPEVVKAYQLLEEHGIYYYTSKADAGRVIAAKYQQFFGENRHKGAKKATVEEEMDIKNRFEQQGINSE